MKTIESQQPRSSLIISEEDQVFNENKKLIDEKSNRHCAVLDPVRIKLNKLVIKKTKAPLYPDKPKKGFRELKVIKNNAYIEKLDLKNLKN